MTNTQHTPAGWYPDANDRAVERYWDGQAWSDRTRPHTDAPTAKPRSNALGIVALAVSVLGFVFACVPGALVIGWIMLPIAFVLGIVAVVLRGKSKWAGLTAIIVAVVGTIVGVIVFFAVVVNAFGSGDTMLTPPDTSETSDSRSDDVDAPAADAGTRENPLQFGTVIDNDDWTVTLTGFIPDAATEVASANRFNDTAPEGQQYVIVEASATYKGQDEGTSSSVQIDYVSADGTVVSTWDSLVAGIEPTFGRATLYAGATDAGKLLFLVPAPANGVIQVQPGLFAEKVFVALP